MVVEKKQLKSKIVGLLSEVQDQINKIIRAGIIEGL